MAVILGAEIYSCPSEAPFALKHSSEGGWVTLNPERPQALCSHQMTTELFHAAPGSLPSCSSGSSHSQKDRSQNRGGKNCVQGRCRPPAVAACLSLSALVSSVGNRDSNPGHQALSGSALAGVPTSSSHTHIPIPPSPPITHPHLPPLTPPSPSLTPSLPLTPIPTS